MPKLDAGRLIRDARELIEESKELCERSRLIIQRSKHLQDRLALSCPKRRDAGRRKRLLAK